MKSDNFVVIQGWMCNELELKGNELLVYALIYGFSQDGESVFSGSRRYIADTFNISLPTVDKALDSLISKGLVTKHTETKNKVQFNTYKANTKPTKDFTSSKETLQGGSKETLHNNIETKNIDTNSINTISRDFLGSANKVDKPKKQNRYSKCMDMINKFTDNAKVRELLIVYLNYRLELKDKPLYANQWKGMLNKLANLCVDDISKYEQVIQYSLERGYLSFYEPKNYSSGTVKNKPWEQGLCSDGYTEDEKREIDRLTAEREARGEQVWY